MREFIFIILIIAGVISCKKEPIPEPKPCSELVNGVYIYPTEKPDSSLSNKEKREYWNIPEEVIACISTEGLIKSCYQMPFSFLISAGNGYQHGYQVVKGWNRGFAELEIRPDVPEKLIEFYDTINIPTNIGYSLFCIEVLIAQDSIITKLTNEQKIKLINLGLKYHPEIRKMWTKGGLMYDGTVVIMCRLMRFDNYEPFLQLLQSNRKYLTFTDGYSYTMSFNEADTLIYHAQNYLTILGNPD